MIQSMTGFAAASMEVAGGSLSLELKSVNHRYLEVHFRLDELLRPAEGLLREAISRRVNRGKVECRLTYTPASRQAAELATNHDLIQRLLQLGSDVQRAAPSATPLSVAEILRWPGVLIEANVDQESLLSACAELIERALADFVTTRAREGDKLAGLLRERVAAMQTIVSELIPALPVIRAAWEERLRARLAELVVQVDQERVHQELALFAQKMDVDEELSRLSAHLEEVLAILSRGGIAGKRLDFLMQELNREANTLGSKSVAAQSTRASLDLKLLIEQMREQIQNIE